MFGNGFGIRNVIILVPLLLTLLLIAVRALTECFVVVAGSSMLCSYAFPFAPGMGLAAVAGILVFVFPGLATRRSLTPPRLSVVLLP